MLWKVWAAVGAIVCGVAVAALPGGSVSPWAFGIFVVAMLVGIGASAAVIIGSYSRQRQMERALQLRVEQAPPPSVRQSVRDREIVEPLLGLLHERDVTWLRTETFSGPWRDDRLAGLRELALVDAARSGIFDPELADEVVRLTEGAKAFLEVHERATVADPVMRDGAWRMVGRVDPTGEVVSTEQMRGEVETSLREAATATCNAYEELRLAAAERFPPPPAVERPASRRR